MNLKSKFCDLFKQRSFINGLQAPAMSRETALVLEVVEAELKQIRLELEIVLQNKTASEAGV